MSWNVDKEPIEYLRQRIKYYKKKRMKMLNVGKNPVMIEKYGEKELRHIVAKRIMQINSLLSMYHKAVSDLEKIEETENK